MFAVFVGIAKEGEDDGRLFQYDSDFGWLMSVVEKVEDLGAEVVQTNGECNISYDEYYEDTSGVGRFGATFNALVKFIKYYNEIQ